jgi:hypothetical protein
MSIAHQVAKEGVPTEFASAVLDCCARLMKVKADQTSAIIAPAIMVQPKSLHEPYKTPGTVAEEYFAGLAQPIVIFTCRSVTLSLLDHRRTRPIRPAYTAKKYVGARQNSTYTRGRD